MKAVAGTLVWMHWIADLLGQRIFHVTRIPNPIHNVEEPHSVVLHSAFLIVSSDSHEGVCVKLKVIKWVSVVTTCQGNMTAHNYEKWNKNKTPIFLIHCDFKTVIPQYEEFFHRWRRILAPYSWNQITLSIVILKTPRTGESLSACIS